MHVTELRTLYEYNEWADKRLLDAAAHLPTEVYQAPISMGDMTVSLHAILIHQVTALWLWRTRCEGHSPTTMLCEADFPTFEALRTRLQAEHEALRGLLRTLTLDDDALAQIVMYRTTGGTEYETPLWQILVHLVNHSTQHRSEVAQVLTAKGASPGDLDMIVYFRTHKTE